MVMMAVLATDLQSSIVVEYGMRGCAVLEKIEVRLQIASMQDLSKDIAAGQVLRSDLPQ